MFICVHCYSYSNAVLLTCLRQGAIINSQSLDLLDGALDFTRLTEGTDLAIRFSNSGDASIGFSLGHTTPTNCNRYKTNK